MEFNNAVSRVYLNKNVIGQIGNHYFKTEVLRLDGFLNELAYERLFDILKNFKFVRKNIPNKFSLGNAERVDEIEKIFSSIDFLNFINFITKKNFVRCNLRINEFQKGDYTLLDGFKQDKKGSEFFFIFSEGWDDSFGGQVVYRINESEDLVFSIMGNSFVLLNKGEDVGRFVKYINHFAGKRKVYLVDGKFE